VEFAGGPFAWVTRTFSASAGNCHHLALLSCGQPIKFAQWLCVLNTKVGTEKSVHSFVAVPYLVSIDAQLLRPLSTCWLDIAGGGAFCNGHRIHVSSNDSVLHYIFDRSFLLAVLQLFNWLSVISSFQLLQLLVTTSLLGREICLGSSFVKTGREVSFGHWIRLWSWRSLGNEPWSFQALYGHHPGTWVTLSIASMSMCIFWVIMTSFSEF